MSSIMMGKRWMADGFEHAEIMISSPSFVEKFLDEVDLFPHVANTTLSGWYMSAGRPHPDDIVGADMHVQGGWYVITLKIRRGVSLLTEFVRRHKITHVVPSDKSMMLHCPACHVEIFIPLEAFGITPGEPPLVHAALTQTPHAASCES